jgi:hypothetical protein
MKQTFIRDFSQVIAATTQADFIDFRVPANQTLIVKSFGNDLSNVLGWTLVHWQLLKNGMGEYPMDDIFDQMGYAAQRQPIENLRWQGGDRFQVRGIANAGTPAGTAVLVSIEYEIIDNV